MTTNWLGGLADLLTVAIIQVLLWGARNASSAAAVHGLTGLGLLLHPTILIDLDDVAFTCSNPLYSNVVFIR